MTALPLILLLSMVLGASPAGAEIVDLSGMFHLENGLDARLMPVAGTPTVAALVLVRTGYASEGASRSGFSHLLEHLVFAGTQKRSKNRIQREVEDLGGYVNGFTRDDYTGYLIVGHRDHLDQLMDVLTDMLFHSTIPEEGVKEAKAVVLEEIRRSQSRPGTKDSERFQALLYEGSPYARTGLGNETTVSSSTREEIEHFYRRAYRPDNMILLLRGGFSVSEAARTVKEAFGSAVMGAENKSIPLPAPPTADRMYQDYSDLPGVKVSIGFAGPDPRHADAQTLELLAGTLGGGDGVLDRALKSAGLKPRSASAYLSVNDGFSRLILTSSLPTGSDPIAVRRIMLDAVQASLDTEDFNDRVSRTREAMVSAEIMGREKLHYFLMGKAPWIVSGSPGQGLSPGRWDHLTAGDLAAAAREYIASRPSISFFTVPKPAKDTRSVSVGPVKAEAMLDNGIHLIAEQRPGSDVFALHLMTRHRSGAESEGLEGIADFLHRLLPRGTDNRTREEIQAQLRTLGASISTAGNPTVPFGDFYTSRLYSYIRLECVTEKAPQTVAVLADMVLNPTLADNDVEETRSQMLDFVSYRGSTPGTLASRSLAGKLYEGVLGADVYGSKESINAITRDALIAFHAQYLVGRNLIVSVVSGMKPEGSIALVESAFKELMAGEPFEVSSIPLTLLPELLERELGKPQGALAVGAVTGEVEDGDIPVLAVSSALLNTRLSEQLREKEGLAYSLGASLGAVGDRAVFTLSMGTAPEKIEKARAGVREQIQAARDAKVTPEEMQREINGLVGRLQMRMLSSINRAYYLGVAARQGLKHSFGEDYRNQLLALTPEDVERVNRRYLPEENLVEVVVR